MLKTRLIPVLLLKNGRMVKTINFSAMRDVGDPVTSARIYNHQTADELVFLDISETKEDKKILFDIITKVAEECFMPLAVGGGIRSIEDIRKLLQAGADKVTINTCAVENPQFIREASLIFGSSTIVVSIDAKKDSHGEYEVYTKNGKEPTGLNPVEWAKRAEQLGAGEILITSIDQEGTLQGYDLSLIEAVAKNVSIPVIANAGAGKLEDFYKAITEGGVSAVAAASIFHFTDQSPIKVRTYLKYRKIDIRNE